MNANADPHWKILVVEDEALLAEEVRDRLQCLGHEVVGVADNGADAIDIARRTRPDLILMDIRIKGDLNGIETADLIHGELGVPVVFSTAHSDRDTLQQAQIAGQFGYLIKPWREQDLLMAIRLAMHRHHTETAARRHRDSSLHSLLETGIHPVILCNAQGRICAVNSSAESVFGYPREMLAGQPFELLLSEQERGAWQALREQAFARHAAHATDDMPTFSAQRRDGQAFPAKVSPTYIETSAGPSLCLIVRDLSDAHTPFDPVTGLPNREKFRDSLVAALQPPGGRLALLLLDLDHFKEINDTLGHETGDRLLAHTAERVREFAGPHGALARLGGDEFALILPGLDGLHAAERTAQRLVEKLSVPFDIDGKPLYLTASAGIATCPDDALTAPDLLKYAEQAMYAAKSGGRNRVVRFSPEMQDGAQKRRALSDDLHGALQRGEFSLHYQPIIDFADGRATKAEALLRWRHPQRGAIPPLDFIPLLEETGLIHEVGEWVFDEAAAQAERLARRLGRTVQISVNMSAVQLAAHGAGAIDWGAKLAALPPPDGRLGIEITESVLIEDQQRVKDCLLDFRSHGVAVSIDDFGTGFSSLSYLKTFSIDFLKIDASFTRGVANDENDHALTEAIIVMAHKLGFRTVAEGVETAQQADILQRMGCDFAQGYLFSRPLPADEFEAYLLASGG
jgi:diguanylate cyclase (GGDEF)-like protein/PAS domain S-box-containing protein